MADDKTVQVQDILEEKDQAAEGDVTSEVVANNPYHVMYDTDMVAAERAKWYVVHTYSGHELKVAEQLKIRLESMHVEKKVFEVVVPAQDKIQVRKGQKRQQRNTAWLHLYQHRG
jgi:transcriptional antiterminator NusG